MIIDIHIHLALPEHEHSWVLDWMRSSYPGDAQAFNTFVREKLDPANLRGYLQENDIDYAVGLAELSPISVGWTSNEYVGKLCATVNELPDPVSGSKGRLIPFANINPFLVNDLANELESLVKEFGFGGIKLLPTYHHHYPNDGRMYPLYAKAQELGLPMLVHTGSSVFKGSRIKYGDPLLLDDVAVDFPHLTILMAHCGRPFWYDHAAWMARQHENVYMEVSGLPAKKLLEYFPRLEELSDKVVYGSDWPGNPDLRRNPDAIRGLPISEKAKQAILYDNAAKILKL